MDPIAVQPDPPSHFSALPMRSVATVKSAKSVFVWLDKAKGIMHVNGILTALITKSAKMLCALLVATRRGCLLTKLWIVNEK
jgi:hypothetical protein